MTPRMADAASDGWADQYCTSMQQGEDWPATASAAGGLREAGMHGIAAALARRARSELEMAYATCESPIEQVMFLGLVTLALARFDGVTVSDPATGDHSFGDPAMAQDFVRIDLQERIGRYRVDFLVAACFRWAGRGGGVERVSYVVECDGHDYHERTRAQAKRDRTRDRTLQAAGYKVYRYTGAEIWADVYGCAREVLRHAADDAIEQAQAAFGARSEGA